MLCFVNAKRIFLVPNNLFESETSEQIACTRIHQSHLTVTYRMSQSRQLKFLTRWDDIRAFFSLYILFKTHRSSDRKLTRPTLNLSSKPMAYYSQAHICQCLTRLSTVRRNSIVTIAGDRQKTGQQFVEDVLSLARGLLELGLKSGDIVAICAFNRLSLCHNSVNARTSASL